LSGVAKDLTGNVYNRLTVLSRKFGAKKPTWLCECVCGKQKAIRADSLKDESIQSCGCLRNEIGTARIGRPGINNPAFKHGHSLAMKRTPTYHSWQAMIARCTRHNSDNYPWYGGRGISVHIKWLGRNGFKEFLKDVGVRPAGLTLDRIDSDGNYEPGNVRWATPSEQNYNRRSNRGRKISAN